MDPNRPRTPEELALVAEANRQPVERPAVETTQVPTTEAAASMPDAETDTTVGPSPNDDATTGALDPADLFGSLDVGAQATPVGVPDSSAKGHSLEISVDEAPASADSFASYTALPPFALDEIVASLPTAPIAPVPAASLAREMVEAWQDLPGEFDSDQDDASTDRRETDISDLPPSRGDADSLNVDGVVKSEPVEPPSGWAEQFDTIEATPNFSPLPHVEIDDLVARPGDPIVIQRGPLRTDDDSWRPSIDLLSATDDDLPVPERPSDAELSPRAAGLQSPTSDGGPPLAQPILLASVLDEQTRRILDEALAEAGRRDAKTAAEIAQQQVEDAFWLRACEERALYRGR